MNMRIHHVWYKTSWYHPHMNKIYIKDRFNDSPVAVYRLRVIEFSNQYGTQPTIDAFKISKRTLYRWKKRYISSKRDANSLIPISKRPKKVRTMLVHINVVNEIRRIRYMYGCIGKRKIKVLLDEYCIRSNYPCISISTIGKVIKRYNMISLNKRIYHNPNTKRRIRTKVSRVKYSPKSSTQGYVEIDTIQRFVDGIRMYIFNAVDINTRFQFSYGYTSSNTKNSIDFVKKLEEVYPIKGGIHTVQTDNGSEYLGEFSKHLKLRGISHKYIYPRCPRINGCVERSNRTLQEEYVYRNEGLVNVSMERFNKGLMEYLIWFNTKRPHESLGDISPIEYMLRFNPECHMYVTCTRFCK